MGCDLAHGAVRAAVVASLLLGACSGGASEAVACDAFQEWEQAGFPGDLLSPDQGPAYLAFLAAVAASRAPVADDASTVHEAAAEMHRIMMESPEPSDGQLEQLGDLNSPDVLAAFQRVTEYGGQSCGVSLYG